jgi:hypothetical protein
MLVTRVTRITRGSQDLATPGRERECTPFWPTFVRPVSGGYAM